MLTEDQIIAKIDEQLNAGRGEPMFVEVEFSVDFHNQTILSFDENENEWLVNEYYVRADDDSVEIAAVPLMSFPKGSLA